MSPRDPKSLCCDFPVGLSIAVLLEDEETDLKEFLGLQRSLLYRYRVARGILLSLGSIFILGTLIWMAYRHEDLSKIAAFIPPFTLLGAGFIATSATTYPVSEILKRKEKIAHCERLLTTIQKVRLEESNRKINAERVKKKVREVIETLKGC